MVPSEYLALFLGLKSGLKSGSGLPVTGTLAWPELLSNASVPVWNAHKSRERQATSL